MAKTARKKSGATKRKPTRKVAKKTASKAPAARRTKRTKDPRGGLTAAGRAAFRKRDGSHLKPGVTKKVADMTPQEMRRKGSWAVRFYGRAKLPPLVDTNGEPTRHALSAHAWGEPVPKTVAAARKIAAKGHKLLDRYERTQAKKTKTSSTPRTSAKKTARKGAARKAPKKTSTARKRKAA